jgi:hypothetical protein
MHISTGHAVVVLIIFVLAIMRLTRLVNADQVSDFFRLWIAGKVRQATLEVEEAAAHTQGARAVRAMDRRDRWSTAFEFVQCPWCIGWWFALAGAYVPVWYIGWPWWSLFPVALATSHLVGLLARFSDTEEIEVEEVEQ